MFHSRKQITDHLLTLGENFKNHLRAHTSSTFSNSKKNDLESFAIEMEEENTQTTSK